MRGIKLSVTLQTCTFAPVVCCSGVLSNDVSEGGVPRSVSSSGICFSPHPPSFLGMASRDSLESLE